MIGSLALAAPVSAAMASRGLMTGEATGAPSLAGRRAAGASSVPGLRSPTTRVVTDASRNMIVVQRSSPAGIAISKLVGFIITGVGEPVGGDGPLRCRRR